MNASRLLAIDRKYIFLAMGLAIALPLVLPIHLKINAQRSSQALFDTVDAIDPAKQGLLVSSDYTPQTEAENQPMTITLMRHAFAKRMPLLLVSLYVECNPLMLNALNQTMAEFNSHATSSADSIKYGRDVVFLGWVPPPIVPILAMGRSITEIYPNDYYGNRTDTLPIMRNIHNYGQIGIVVAITRVDSPLWYVQLAQTKFGVKVGGGCTAVSTPDLYPYFETRQLSGIMGGMRGAADYESLVEEKYHSGGRMRATEGMGAQSIAHVVIIVFVLLGNLGYFLGKRRSA